MATIETRSGPVEEEDLGLTLPHEHIRSTSEAVRITSRTSTTSRRSSTGR